MRHITAHLWLTVQFAVHLQRLSNGEHRPENLRRRPRFLPSVCGKFAWYISRPGGISGAIRRKSAPAPREIFLVYLGTRQICHDWLEKDYGLLGLFLQKSSDRPTL